MLTIHWLCGRALSRLGRPSQQRVGRKGMFAVLQQGQNIVHSDLDFRNRFHERFPNIDLSTCGNPLITQQASMPASLPSSGFFEVMKASLFAVWHKAEPITTRSQM